VAGLLGLLEVGNHGTRVLKEGSEVNATFEQGSHSRLSAFVPARLQRTAKSGCPTKRLEARGGIEPPIKVLQTFALPLGDRASEINAFYQKIPSIVFPPTSPFEKKSRGVTFHPPRSCQTDLAGLN
jgi:hypothetical protein